MVPGLVVSDRETATGADSPKKWKKVKSTADSPEGGSPVSSDKEMRKKKKKDRRSEGMVNASSPAEQSGLKRKKASASDEEPPLKKGKLYNDDSKGIRVMADDDYDTTASLQDSKQIDPMAVSSFNISEAVRSKLKEKGIESLFPIQAQTFDTVMGGDDLVGRARTGQGKTLAFVLPIVETLADKKKMHAKRPYGRAPGVIVLAPTRELAKQVFADFENYGRAVGLTSVCVYGGSPYAPQENALRKGADIVVGTPGRIKDLMEKGTLNLKTLKFRVLDEADEMLKMGFVEDVEKILGGVDDPSSVQTLLFSATMPQWVKQIAAKFLKASRRTVDLVGNEEMKASSSVRHLLMPCAYQVRSQVVSDVISCYSSGGKTIVFTETKNDASELAGALSSSARALHGDIAQGQREVTMQAFREKKFQILVATDVAARGLDVNDVQLVIQCEPPKDVETYIHRSGRTGRAGHTGISVLLYDRKKAYMVPTIERGAGFKFERIAAPQPADIAKASATSALDGIRDVSDSVIPVFRAAAQNLLDNSGLPPVDILAKALAKISGHTDVSRRSLLSSIDGATTLILEIQVFMQSTGYAFNCLRKFLPDEVVRSEVSRMSLSRDGYSAVFDLPSKLAADFTEPKESSLFGNAFTIRIADRIPELQIRQYASGTGRGGGRNGGSGSGRGGGRGGSSAGRGGGGQQRRW